MFTIKEIKEINNGSFTDCEVYKPVFDNDDDKAFEFCTDYIKYTDDYSYTDEVLTYQIMDIEDLNNSVYSNSGMTAEDCGYTYEDKILMILIKKESVKQLISLTEYAAKIGKEASYVRRKAEKGDFKTAQKIGRNWVINENEPYVDNRRKEVKQDD